MIGIVIKGIKWTIYDSKIGNSSPTPIQV
jgi:hypothetical protein